ncbi:MAG: hypothetical protein JOZ50_13145 [Candidatus Eremiobacteraeota bacterium]|nr:hypothetical protein [Candidatus Eremiobacteraeota bacterium]
MRPHPTARMVIAFAATCAAFALGTAPAAAHACDQPWCYSATPYLWLPNMNGEVSYRLTTLPGTNGTIVCAPSCTVDVAMEPSAYLQNLKFVGMLTAEATNGHWGLSIDCINFNFSGGSSDIVSASGGHGPLRITEDFESTTSVVGTIVTMAISHPIVDHATLYGEALAGFRETALSAQTQWDAGSSSGSLASGSSISKEVEPTDLIAGLKGQWHVNHRLFVPYYVDVGAGTRSSTWQGIIGVGYGENASVELVYRNLAYTSASKQYTSSSDAFTNTKFEGPALGYTFRF